MLNDQRIRTSLLALSTDIFLVAFKLILSIIIGSTVILADAFHSLADMLISLILLSSILVKYIQEKKGCPKGLSFAHKLESVLSFFVALIILYVPFEIIGALRTPHEPISHIGVGIAGMLFIILLLTYMSYLKISTGRKKNSPALEADGYHSLVDVLTSVAVLVSLVAGLYGLHIDKFVAIAIAVLIALSGIKLMLTAIKNLIKENVFSIMATKIRAYIS